MLQKSERTKGRFFEQREGFYEFTIFRVHFDRHRPAAVFVKRDDGIDAVLSSFSAGEHGASTPGAVEV